MSDFDSVVAKCALCGGPAHAFVVIRGARREYKYRESHRCKACIEKAVKTYGEEDVLVGPLK
jgi:hypothetical protein